MIAVYHDNKSNKMYVVEVKSDDATALIILIDGRDDLPWPTSEVLFFERDIEINRYTLT